MAYQPDPRLLRAIRTRVPRNLQPLLLATALVESGGRLDAVGDHGQSFGPYQEYTGGRGAGIPPQQRMDPVASTLRALKEFRSLSGKYHGAELAYRAQRPADREGYIRKINAAFPVAMRFLGAGGAPDSVGSSAADPAGGAPSPSPAGSPQIDGAALMRILNASSPGVQQGQQVGADFGNELYDLVRKGMASRAPAAPPAPEGPPAPQAAPGALPTAYTGPLDRIPARNVPFGADPQGDYDWAERLAKQFGLKLTSGYRNPAQQRATGSRAGLRSRHLVHGGAADIAGSPEAMRRLAEWAIRSGLFAEVFYDPVGQWDNGRFSRRGIGGHSDHVHLSYGLPIGQSRRR